MIRVLSERYGAKRAEAKQHTQRVSIQGMLRVPDKEHSVVTGQVLFYAVPTKTCGASLPPDKE